MNEIIIVAAAASLCSFFLLSSAIDSLKQNQSITDNQNLVSSGERFELGFFNPGNEKFYLGVWFKNISVRTVVWVANRDTPLANSSGSSLSIDELGNLVILNETQTVVWSSSSFSSSNSSKEEQPIAQLLDTGNLVLKYHSQESYIWQSFDYPSDTLLDGMKFGYNLRTGIKWQLTSWKDNTDPSSGDFSYSIDGHGYPQPFLRNGSTSLFRTGPWNGLTFSGAPEMAPNYNQTFVIDSEEVYFKGQLMTDSVVIRFVLDSSGTLKRLAWNEKNAEWKELVSTPKDRCDTYSLCGAYGACSIDDTPVCHCLTGFTPASPDDWNQVDFTDGCKRKTPLNCNGDGFFKRTSTKLPDTSTSLVNTTMTLKECEVECLKNCSCVAYANSDIREGGSGCLLWFGVLVDIKLYNADGQDLYVRLAASDLDAISSRQQKEKRLAIILSVSVVMGTLLLSSAICFAIWKIRRNRRDKSENNDIELPLFDYGIIARATDNFALSHKLGEGGFGPVYKGKLPMGEEIAVKRLSGNSGQGLNEFKNEIILIAKLQHRNLVRLLGCCIQNDENMLVYEYMPSGSLDSFIFGKTESSLNWQKRVHIIEGIAQGLLYLHRHSRLRIIHRDLKASNVLLDNEMNPKISDFGTARLFKGDQTEAKTKRVFGTYGYMSPEYAIDGRFSMKSDVFSFGVLILEIVSGKRNRGFHHPEHNFSLLGHAWNLWNDDKALELLHTSLIRDSPPMFEVLRCIQVGLLCVQQDPEDRPSMSSVVLMLGSEGAVLPKPKQPGFYYERNLNEADSSCKKDCSSSNEITYTLFDGR